MAAAKLMHLFNPNTYRKDFVTETLLPGTQFTAIDRPPGLHGGAGNMRFLPLHLATME